MSLNLCSSVVTPSCAKRVMPAGECSPNDLQVHNISSGVALAKMTVISVNNNCFAFDPIKYRNIDVKIKCYLFVYRWNQLMIAWGLLVFRSRKVFHTGSGRYAEVDFFHPIVNSLGWKIN